MTTRPPQSKSSAKTSSVEVRRIAKTKVMDENKLRVTMSFVLDLSAPDQVATLNELVIFMNKILTPEEKVEVLRQMEAFREGKP